MSGAARPDPAAIDRVIGRFILLAELATDLCIRRYGGQTILDAFANGGLRFRLVAVNRLLGCKRHGAGAYYFFRGALRDYAGCREISIDYDRAGQIVVPVWHLADYVQAILGEKPDAALLRSLAERHLARFPDRLSLHP